MDQLFMGFATQVEKQLAEGAQGGNRRVIVLSGPTGAGKTAFSIALAKRLGGEIVSADSIQVYRGMDIGTAKLPVEERLEIPHHLIDLCPVSTHFNVVDFYYEATQHCKDILQRGAVPIVVGGSGFYLHAFLYGPPSGPPPVPEVRSKLEKEADTLGVDALYQRLRILDAHYASTITKSDRQKIIRALEIMTVTGKKVSKLSWRARPFPQLFDFRCWFLYRPREKLYSRINARFDQMVEAGLLDEVRRLEKQGIRENPSASQAIGYKQALEYLDSPQTEEDYRYFIEKAKQVSRHCAKKQFTWFRKESLFSWLDLDMHDPEVALDMVAKGYLER